jgi:hypothetical protein
MYTSHPEPYPSIPDLHPFSFHRSCLAPESFQSQLPKFKRSKYRIHLHHRLRKHPCRRHVNFFEKRPERLRKKRHIDNNALDNIQQRNENKQSVHSSKTLETCVKVPGYGCHPQLQRNYRAELVLVKGLEPGVEKLRRRVASMLNKLVVVRRILFLRPLLLPLRFDEVN